MIRHCKNNRRTNAYAMVQPSSIILDEIALASRANSMGSSVNQSTHGMKYLGFDRVRARLDGQRPMICRFRVKIESPGDVRSTHIGDAVASVCVIELLVSVSSKIRGY